MQQPLSGIKVVDATSALSGPYCTMLLGDMGAEVIKIEPIEGDMVRNSPPFIKGESAYFLYTNRNKRGITLNLKSEEGRNILLKLIGNADIFVENFKPQTKNKLRFDYPTLKEKNPGLIYCSISGFGQTGPWADRPGFDQIAQGMSGLMSITGFPESEPTRVGVAIGDSIAGLFATYGILAALFERSKSGRGQYIETSLLEGLVAVLSFQAAKYFGTGETPLPQGNDHAALSPYGTFITKDGYINISAVGERMWRNLCRRLGMEDLVDHPDFRTNPERVKNKGELRKIIEKHLTHKTTEEWVDILNEEGIPCGPIYTIDQVFRSKHILHREMLLEAEHASAGMIKMIGFPVKMSTTPCSARLTPPNLGQHTNEVLMELNYSEDEIKKLKQKGIV